MQIMHFTIDSALSLSKTSTKYYPALNLFYYHSKKMMKMTKKMTKKNRSSNNISDAATLLNAFFDIK